MNVSRPFTRLMRPRRFCISANVVLLLMFAVQSSLFCPQSFAAPSTSVGISILRDLSHDACVTIAGPSANAGVTVNFCGATGDGQLYQFSTLSDGNIKINTMNGTTYCLTHLGGTVVSTTCTGDLSQEWSVKVVTRGMNLQTADGTSCLSDPADWNSNASTMQSCASTDNQLFRNTLFLASTAPSTPTAQAACGPTASGSTVWVDGLSGFSTVAASTQQCANGGTVTTTWLNQTQALCTNGTLTSTGQARQANLSMAAAVCDAAPSIPITPSSPGIPISTDAGSGTVLGSSILRDIVHDACATVANSSNNAAVAANFCGAFGDAQLFQFSLLSDGQIKITTLNGTTNCLAHSGSTVVSSVCANDPSQEWAVQVVSKGMTLKTVDGTVCLADPADYNSSSTTMQTCTGADNQIFRNNLFSASTASSGSSSTGTSGSSSGPSGGAGATVPVSVSSVTVLPASQASQVAPPGAILNIGTNFTAVSPLSAAYNLTIYLTDNTGKTVASVMDTLDQFDSKVPTTEWQGAITVVRPMQVPSVADGTYQVMVALTDAANQGVALSAAQGVTQDNQHRYAIGTVTVRASAAVPSLLAPPSLDLTGFNLTFDDEFQSLSLSDGSRYNGSKWYTHNEQCCMQTTDGSETSMYGMNDPQNPYSIVAGGGLNIRLQKVNNHWSSGVLTSVDSAGAGFSQQYGYFEMSAQFPSGLNTWPAFWLLNTASKASHAAVGEIDVVEYIANPAFLNTIRTTLHDMSNNSTPNQSWNQVTNPSDSKFHTYGLLWTAQTMTFYFDGTVFFACPTPTVMQQPYYMLVDLGIGSGYPTNATPSVNDMVVKYVRAYALPPGR